MIPSRCTSLVAALGICLSGAWATAARAQNTAPRAAEPAPAPRYKLVAEPSPPSTVVPEMQDRAPPRGEAFPPPVQRNDPTVPDPTLRGLIEQGATREPAAKAAVGAPDIRLLARIIVRDRPPVAVLEIGTRLVTVHPDSEFQVSTSEGSVQIKVIELNASQVRIEIPNRNQVITLN